MPLFPGDSSGPPVPWPSEAPTLPFPHVSLFAGWLCQVDLAGSTTIDNELINYFKGINNAALARCGSHLEPQPALEPCAPLASTEALGIIPNTPVHYRSERFEP